MTIEQHTYNDRVEATTSSRVHFGLTVDGDVVVHPELGLHIFGGGGAATDAFPTAVRAERTGRPGLEIDYKPNGLVLPADYYWSDRTQQYVEEMAGVILDEASRRDKLGEGGVRATVLSSAPEHIGLGSKTSLAMAVAYSLGNLLLAERGDWQRGTTLLSHNEIRQLSGRGGTSRIGVLACEHGGVIFEDGHQVSEGAAPLFLPSSRRIPKDNPIPSKVIHLPDSFRIALFMDTDTPRISGQEEADIFRQNMPFDPREVLMAIAQERAMKAAFDRRDMSALSEAFRRFSSLCLKRAEVDRQSDIAKSWLSDCWDDGYVVGVSSFGPVMFAIAEEDSDEMGGAYELAQRGDLLPLGTYRFNNEGANIAWRWGWQDVLANMIRDYDERTAREGAFLSRIRER